jgi:hypothetical protein
MLSLEVARWAQDLATAKASHPFARGNIECVEGSRSQKGIFDAQNRIGGIESPS